MTTLRIEQWHKYRAGIREQQGQLNRKTGEKRTNDEDRNSLDKILILNYIELEIINSINYKEQKKYLEL